MAIAILIIVLIILVVVAVVVSRKIKNILDNPEEHQPEDTSIDTSKGNEGSKNAQSFLQFEDIKNNIIDLGNDKYRMIVEVSSTNYYLKTESEKQTIEMSFQNFLNSLSFPITIYCQTKVIDDTKMLMHLKEDIINAVDEFPTLKNYGEIFYSEMQQIHDYTGNNKSKKKYIIVPFEDLDELTEFSKEEKYQEALKRIQERAQYIIESLAPIDLKGKILNTNELIELVYSSYNKGDLANPEMISSGEYMQMIVTGPNRLNDVDGVTMTDYILFETQNEIKNKVLNKDLPEYQVQVYSQIIEHIGQIRDSIVDLDE